MPTNTSDLPPLPQEIDEFPPLPEADATPPLPASPLLQPSPAEQESSSEDEDPGSPPPEDELPEFPQSAGEATASPLASAKPAKPAKPARKSVLISQPLPATRSEQYVAQANEAPSIPFGLKFHRDYEAENFVSGTMGMEDDHNYLPKIGSVVTNKDGVWVITTSKQKGFDGKVTVTRLGRRGIETKEIRELEKDNLRIFAPNTNLSNEEFLRSFLENIKDIAESGIKLDSRKVAGAQLGETVRRGSLVAGKARAQIGETRRKASVVAGKVVSFLGVASVVAPKDVKPSEEEGAVDQSILTESSHEKFIDHFRNFLAYKIAHQSEYSEVNNLSTTKVGWILLALQYSYLQNTNAGLLNKVETQITDCLGEAHTLLGTGKKSLKAKKEPQSHFLDGGSIKKALNQLDEKDCSLSNNLTLLTSYLPDGLKVKSSKIVWDDFEKIITSGIRDPEEFHSPENPAGEEAVEDREGDSVLTRINPERQPSLANQVEEAPSSSPSPSASSRESLAVSAGKGGGSGGRT